MCDELKVFWVCWVWSLLSVGAHSPVFSQPPEPCDKLLCSLNTEKDLREARTLLAFILPPQRVSSIINSLGAELTCLTA